MEFLQDILAPGASKSGQLLYAAYGQPKRIVPVWLCRHLHRQLRDNYYHKREIADDESCGSYLKFC